MVTSTQGQKKQLHKLYHSIIYLSIASAPSSARSPPLPMSAPQTVPEAGLGKAVCIRSLYYLMRFAMVLSVAPSPSSTIPSRVPMVTPNTAAGVQLGRSVYIYMYIH